MATILTTTGISLYNYTKNSTRPDEPTVDQMRQSLRLNPERASSEANSLLKIAKPDDNLVLFHTKTPSAIKCADLLQKYFEAEGYKRVRLVTLDFEEKPEQIEKTGLRSLVNMLIDEIKNCSAKLTRHHYQCYRRFQGTSGL